LKSGGGFLKAAVSALKAVEIVSRTFVTVCNSPQFDACVAKGGD
jgi:hypothetical protein